MREDVAAWIRKAEGDLRSARHLMALHPPESDAVAFHSQQAAEKYLKAALLALELDPPRTHDLILLIDLLLECGVDLPALKESAEPLSPLAVRVRYPFTGASESQAADALKRAERICSRLRDWLAGIE